MAMTVAQLDSASPTISVILPVYNAERYLRDAVASVLAQTFDDFELLAFDDGSTDRSLKILRGFEAKDGRVRALSRENRGLVQTLNELIGLARGRYLARMDADDVCRPQRFEKQIAYLESHTECVAVGTGFLLIDPNGRPIREHSYELIHDEIDKIHLSGEGFSRLCHPSTIMRKDAVLQIGLYREEFRLAEDLDLFLRLAEIGKLANIPDIMLEYRHHLGSVCYKYADEQRNVGQRAVEMARMRRGIVIHPEIHRSPANNASTADTHRKWAWWALSAGNVATARQHAIMALAKEPFNKENFRLFACAMRGW
jgi:glycosyltransferase involved in cell wall biosynthesis